MSNSNILLLLDTMGKHDNSLILSLTAARFNPSTGEIIHKVNYLYTLGDQEGSICAIDLGNKLMASSNYYSRTINGIFVDGFSLPPQKMRDIKEQLNITPYDILWAYDPELCLKQIDNYIEDEEDENPFYTLEHVSLESLVNFTRATPILSDDNPDQKVTEIVGWIKSLKDIFHASTPQVAEPDHCCLRPGLTPEDIGNC